VFGFQWRDSLLDADAACGRVGGVAHEIKVRSQGFQGIY